MIDGSHVNFEDNIAITSSVTKFAGPINLRVPHPTHAVLRLPRRPAHADG